MASRQEQSQSYGRQTKTSVGLRRTLQYLSPQRWTQTKMKVDDLLANGDLHGNPRRTPHTNCSDGLIRKPMRQQKILDPRPCANTSSHNHAFRSACWMLADLI
jgi:hypothetical protein